MKGLASDEELWKKRYGGSEGDEAREHGEDEGEGERDGEEKRAIFFRVLGGR